MRIGISASVIVVALVIVIAIVGIGYFLALSPTGGSSTSQTTPSSSSSSSSSANLTPSQVTAQIQAFQSTFNNRSEIAQLPNFYAQSAVVVWTGSAGGEAGTTSGRGNIGLLYDATIGRTTSLQVGMTNIQTKVVNPSTINTTLSIQMTGVSTVLGKFNATIDASQSWISQGGQVLMQSETWDYISLKAQNNVGATVFPQWGLQLTGNPPNLSHEHVIEWNLAPFLGAGIYVSITVLVIATLWVRLRKQKK